MTEQKKNAPKLSIYIPEELRTRFKIACAAEQTSMNQVLADFIEQWTDEHDPMRKAILSAQQDNPPASSAKGTGGKGKGKGVKDD